jgi:hypothetical protein
LSSVLIFRFSAFGEGVKEFGGFILTVSEGCGEETFGDGEEGEETEAPDTGETEGFAGLSVWVHPFRIQKHRRTANKFNSFAI